MQVSKNIYQGETAASDADIDGQSTRAPVGINCAVGRSTYYAYGPRPWPVRRLDKQRIRAHRRLLNDQIRRSIRLYLPVRYFSFFVRKFSIPFTCTVRIGSFARQKLQVQGVKWKDARARYVPMINCEHKFAVYTSQ